jgi:mRNA interferase HigB
MNVVSLKRLRDFWARHPQAERPLRAWYAIARKARWDQPADIKAGFGTNVDFVGDNRAVFDVGGNKYRLVVRVSYRFKQVQVKFVGTHRDYDVIDVETV